MLDQSLTGAAPRSKRSLIENFVRPFMSVSRWIDLHCQREQLAELEDHHLADLGLSRAEVRRECAKWPWQA
jgi:uncharacterized protein YjiS (DUF1127 family)